MSMMPSHVKSMRTLMFVGYIIYAISFILPSFALTGSGGFMDPKETLPGISCAFFAIVICLDHPIYALGSVANVLMIINLFVNLIAKNRANLRVYCIINIGFCNISTLSWLFFPAIDDGSLSIGYYVWMLAVGLASVSFFLYRKRLEEWAKKQHQGGLNIEQHLIDSNEI